MFNFKRKFVCFVLLIMREEEKEEEETTRRLRDTDIHTDRHAHIITCMHYYIVSIFI